MKIIFAVIIIAHGLLHLLGVAKAFDLAQIPQLTERISKPMGTLWAVAALLFLATATLFLRSSQLWYVVGAIAILVSQGVIITSWTDAKFGTIPNIIVLIGLVAATCPRGL
ncbi:MAG TPA: hypothetical protein PLH94_11690 [Fimbriimonadaceae bacterium]|nr:hypothetical protein [Fimbriimonadaceae bacterium]